MTEVLKVQGKGIFEGALECGLSGREGREGDASVAAGSCWKLLEDTGRYQKMLEDARRCWKIPEDARRCRKRSEGGNSWRLAGSC